MADYSILIDGGGTHTRVALAADKKIVRRMDEVSAKPNVVGVQQSAALLFAWMQTLCTKASVDFAQVKNIVIGMAGVWEEAERKALEQALHAVATTQGYNPPNTLVCSDVEIAYNAAFGVKGNGILVIAGTGAIALTRDSNGVLQRAGGYAIPGGDEGSGAWIGRKGLQVVLKELDNRGEPSEITRMVIALCSSVFSDYVPTPREIALRYNGSLSQVAILADIVLSCASPRFKDAQAIAIVNAAADELLILAKSLLHYHSQESVPLALWGGIARELSMQTRLRKRLKGDTSLVIVPTKGSAIDGALAMVE